MPRRSSAWAISASRGSRSSTRATVFPGRNRARCPPSAAITGSSRRTPSGSAIPSGSTSATSCPGHPVGGRRPAYRPPQHHHRLRHRRHRGQGDRSHADRGQYHLPLRLALRLATLRVWRDQGPRHKSCLLRRNVITDTVAALRHLDGLQQRQFALHGQRHRQRGRASGGIFIEASQRPNLVDTNVVWGTRRQRHLPTRLRRTDHCPQLRGQVHRCRRPHVDLYGRIVHGRLTTAKRNKVLNNVFVDNARPLAIRTRQPSDNNVFVPAPGRPFDLAKWRATTGWDKHSLTTPSNRVYARDPGAKVGGTGGISRLSPVPGVAYDFWRQPLRKEEVAPGPFAVMPPAGRTVGLAPR